MTCCVPSFSMVWSVFSLYLYNLDLYSFSKTLQPHHNACQVFSLSVIFSSRVLDFNLLFGGQQIFLALVWHLTILGTLLWFLEMFLLWKPKLWQSASINLILCEGAAIKLFPCVLVTPWWHCTFLALVLPLAATGSSRSALYQLYCSTSKENTSIWCSHSADPKKPYILKSPQTHQLNSA